VGVPVDEFDWPIAAPQRAPPNKLLKLTAARHANFVRMALDHRI
jgi:hypothetical protein